MSYRNPVLTQVLQDLLRRDLEDKNFIDTRTLIKKYNLSGKRISIALQRLGWTRYSQGKNCQIYKRGGYDLE